MDKARKNELLDCLVDIRRLSTDDEYTFNRIKNGELTQLTNSIFADTEVWSGFRRHEQSFLRCCAASMQSTKAILVGRSAARVCGVWLINSPGEQVQVALPSGKPPSKSGLGCTYKRMVVPDGDVICRGSIRFTNALRTAIDVARDGDFRDGVVAFESLLVGHTDASAALVKAECQAVMFRMQGTRGIAKARKALERATNLSESPYETRLRLLLEQQGYRCHAQVVIGRYRVDLLVGKNVVVEIDGRGKYDDDPLRAVDDQRTREDWIREQGYLVVRVKTEEIDRNENAVLRRIDKKLQQAGERPNVDEPARYYIPPGPGRQEFFSQSLIDDLAHMRTSRKW